MAKLLVVPVSAGLDATAASKAFAAALGAQVFQPLDASAESGQTLPVRQKRRAGIVFGCRRSLGIAI